MTEKELKEHALALWTPIKEAGPSINKLSMLVGYNAYRLKEENLFGVVGFASEEEARKAAGVGESTWYAVIALAKKFPEVTEKRFVAMKQANAKALADLPDTKRQSTEWLRMAEVDPIEAFREKIERELNGKARASDTQERSTKMTFSVPESRKTVIEERVALFAEAHGLDKNDTGKTLEIMCLETTEVPTLIGSVTNAVQRVKGIKEMMHSGLSADEIVTKVEEQLDEMVLEFSTALAQASAKMKEQAAA